MKYVVRLLLKQMFIDFSQEFPNSSYQKITKNTIQELGFGKYKSTKLIPRYPRFGK